MKKIGIFLLELLFAAFPSFGNASDTITIAEQYSEPNSDFSYEISEMKYDYELTHNDRTGRYGSNGTFSFRIKARGVNYIHVLKSIPYSTNIPFHWSTKRSFDEAGPDGTFDVVYSRDQIAYGVGFRVVFFPIGAEHSTPSKIFSCNDFITDEHLELIKQSYSSSVGEIAYTESILEIRDGKIIWGNQETNVNSLALYSINGKEVMRMEKVRIDARQEISLDEYKKGVYILHIQLDNQSITKKIML